MRGGSTPSVDEGSRGPGGRSSRTRTRLWRASCAGSWTRGRRSPPSRRGVGRRRRTITGGHSKLAQALLLVVKIGKHLGILCVPQVLFTMVPRNTGPGGQAGGWQAGWRRCCCCCCYCDYVTLTHCNSSSAVPGHKTGLQPSWLCCSCALFWVVLVNLRVHDGRQKQSRSAQDTLRRRTG